MEKSSSNVSYVVADNHWHTISTKYIPQTVLKTRNKHTSALQIMTSILANRYVYKISSTFVLLDIHMLGFCLSH